MVTVTGNFLPWERPKVPFNALLDCTLSDAVPGTGGGAAILNSTTQGLTFQNDLLKGATIWLLFLDGIQFTQVFDIGDLDASQKQFFLNSTTGTVTFSYNIDDPVAITIFYSSSGTVGMPPSEPVTRQEAIDYCKLDTGVIDGTIIDNMITTAREQCEDFTGISIVNRTVTAIINNSCGGMYLPYGPVISITSITDQDGNTIETDDYELSGLYFKQLISPWYDRIKLVYTAGYGIPPAKIKMAILQQFFYLYENRGEIAQIATRTGTTIDITLSPQAKSTLQRIRRV